MTAKLQEAIGPYEKATEVYDGAEDISVEALALLVDLSPFHFSRVFKHATGMSPLQFVTGWVSASARMYMGLGKNTRIKSASDFYPQTGI